MSLPRQFSFAQELDQPCIEDLPLESVAARALSGAGSLLSVQSAPPAQSPPPVQPPASPQSTPPLVLHAAALKLLLADPSPPPTELHYYVTALPPGTKAKERDLEEDSQLTLSSLTSRPLLPHSQANKLMTLDDKCSEEYIPDYDGGYAWVIVCGAFLVQFWVAGLFKSYGVLYIEILENFPDYSESLASWIPALLSTLSLALAPVSSALSERFSCRVVVFVGGVFCASGLALSFFATSLVHLLLSFGLLTGIGGGLSTTPGVVIVSQYFDKRRALANGLCVSGTAAGSIVFPVLIEKLSLQFDFHGTMLLLGAGMLHVCLAAMFYKAPPVLHCPVLPALTASPDTPPALVAARRPELQNLFIEGVTVEGNKGEEAAKRTNLVSQIIHPSLIEVAPLQLSDSEDSEGLDVLGVSGRLAGARLGALRTTRSSSLLHSVEDLSTDSTCVYKSTNRRLARSMYVRRPSRRRLLVPVGVACERDEKTRLQPEAEPDRSPPAPATPPPSTFPYLDLSVLREWQFLAICASVALMSCGTPYALYYLPAHSVAIGHSKASSGLLVAISATFDLCGRLLLGYLCDLQIFSRKKAYILSIIIAGSSVLTLPHLATWWPLALAAACYGLCLGCWFLLVPVLLADVFGTERIASTYALVRLCQSVAAMSVPPIAGMLRDVSAGYAWCFYGMGACMVVGALPALALRMPGPVPSPPPSTGARPRV